ncbi:MAG: TasA family protein, partial [Senegalia sp. (in: firmicutes)]
MKKRILISLSLVVVFAFVLGATFAWFTDSSGAVTNTFTAGTVAVEVNENGFENIDNWNPGDTTNKDVTVISKGSKKTYVRVKLTKMWTNQLPNDNVELVLANSGDWVYSDGWYYYKHILNENEETTKLLDAVKLIGPITDNEYQGQTLTVNVEAEAVQATHEAFKDVWGLTS